MVSFLVASLAGASFSVPAPAEAQAGGYAEAVRELVQVETSVDTDADGAPDRVAAYVIRPRSTERGHRVPVIIETDPYWAGLVDVTPHPAEVRTVPELAPWQPPAGGGPSDYSGGYYDNYFVPRGYAVVEMASLGTGDSGGCPSTGGKAESEAVKAVAEWLNGRRTAWRTDGTMVSANWSTGASALVGLSYGASLALGGAVAGAPGVRAVVASAAVTDWYRYYRANGAHVAARGYAGDDADQHSKLLLTGSDPRRCESHIRRMEQEMDHISGDRNTFWDDRDLTRDLRKLKAAVFLVAGLNDDNVRAAHSTRMWQALEHAGVERRMWLHLGGHDDPVDVRGAEWLRTAERYFDHHLKGRDSGWERSPVVSVETAPGRWADHRRWPAPGVRETPLTGSGSALFVDDPAQSAADLVTAGGVQVAVTEPLSRPARLSGSADVTVRASVDGPAPYLTALLVDLGDADRVVGRTTTDQRWCFAPVTAEDGYGCRQRTRPVVERAPFRILSRGWLDVRNRVSEYRETDVDPNRRYTFTWRTEPTDHVVPAGHRIAIVIIGTDREHTLHYPGGTRITVDLERSSVRVPLVTGHW
ncbi:CocE/NonD family hydrolase [Lentzea sp. DG1S-22]|uniref:CocE/NonD family hydrolase n=1 Tax=Lentzea sp. DG1S-22 TaxID=3108822 RepID=UPI002E791383|nr:CocE/NonD family hydrolase [Lentzea sp. DG1S-22]WVH82068.1 CocE/NonD family hydrolase [Lentzea sp. DG1S-22]